LTGAIVLKENAPQWRTSPEQGGSADIDWDVDMDWNMVAALAGVVAALAAVIGAWGIVRQTYRTTRVQVLLQLLSEWQPPRMGRIRSSAASGILGSDPSSPYIHDVLYVAL
jgi:hypothetical protein